MTPPRSVDGNSPSQGAGASESSGLGHRSKVALLVIMLVAFGLRLLHVIGNGSSPYYDEPIMDPLYHLEWAKSFALGEPYQAGPFFRAPLYPWFLGALLKVSGGSLFFVYVMQALLGTLTVWLVHNLTKRLFDARAALGAASLVAVNWVLIYFGAELLIPALSIPMNIGALLFTVRAQQVENPKARGKFAMLAGLMWGLSAIARPNVLLFMPFVFAWLIWNARPVWRAGLKTAIALTLGTLAPILPITIYNATTGADTVLISSQAGVNLWIGNNPLSDGSTAIVPGTRPGWWEGFHDSISLAEQAEGRELKPSEVSSHYTGRALAYFSEQPGAAFAHVGWKLRLFLANWELGNNADVHFFAHHFSPWMWGLPPSIALLLPLALIGLLAGRKRAAELFPIWGFLVVYSGTVVLFFVCSRFRAPLLPVLAVPAGQALVLAFDTVRAKRWKSVALGALFALGLGAMTLIHPPGVDTSGSMGHWALGIAELENGDASEAKQHFQAALDSNPRNLYATRDMARAHKLAGELLPASELYVRALNLKPNEVDTRSELVDLLIARGELTDARQVAQDGLLHSPEFGMSYDALARVLTTAKEWKPAIAALREGLEREPNHFLCNLRLGALLHQEGDSCAARDYLRVAATSTDPAANDLRNQAAGLLQVCETACANQ